MHQSRYSTPLLVLLRRACQLQRQGCDAELGFCVFYFINVYAPRSRLRSAIPDSPISTHVGVCCLLINYDGAEEEGSSIIILAVERESCCE